MVDHKKYNNLSMKLNLCYNTTLKQTEENYNPTFKLLSNIKEIYTILEINESNVLKFLYFNRNNNNKILYDNNENIFINILGDIKSNIYLYFYLILLIEENTNVVNYTYSINLIKDLNEEQIKLKKQKIKKVIIAKIIIDLIAYYDQSDEDNDDDESNKKKNLNF